jgi:hypothetical protein
VGSDTLASPHGLARVDRDVVSRFATCCRALGLPVHDRQRPADLTAARAGFAALTHLAHDQCDAWTGLAASGEVSPTVIESVWRTSATAGVLQRQIELAPGALGFTYDTGLYLQFRAANPDDFQLAYAAALSETGAYADADQLVGELIGLDEVKYQVARLKSSVAMAIRRQERGPDRRAAHEPSRVRGPARYR